MTPRERVLLATWWWRIGNHPGARGVDWEQQDAREWPDLFGLDLPRENSAACV